MVKCPECQHEFEELPAVRKDDFSIAVTDDMKNTAYVLKQHPSCKEEWKAFLQQLSGRSYITEKQKKFYSVIHKECLGNWPARPSEDAVKTAPAPVPDLGF